MEETIGNEKDFRMNFKRSTKGVWTGEFTCRAETCDDLAVKIEHAKTLFHDQLKWLNAKEEILKEKEEGNHRD